MSVAHPPAAVLFDYGGVLTDVNHVDAGYREVAAAVVELLASHGECGLDVADVETDLRAGAAAYDSLKRAQARLRHPRETTHEGFWELVVCDWPSTYQDVVFASAGPLCAHFEFATLQRPAKVGAAETLATLRARGIATALVCNCISGDAARRQMRLDHLSGLLDVELFSDEVGIRKPDPEFMMAAVRALGVAPADAWFVGDKFDRDILGARRAGLGAAILMTSAAGPGQQPRGIDADFTIDSPEQLLEFLA